jgi:HD-GYP domain-containing protein (c-di-GMP phosphodiesterase class II)
MSDDQFAMGEEHKLASLDYFHSKNLLEKTRDVLKYFSIAKKAASIYPRHHEMCIKSIAEFMDVFQDYLTLRDDFSLRLIGDEFFFEEKLMARESVLYYPLIKELQEKEIGGITIQGAITAAEFVDFLYLLNLNAEELKRQAGLRDMLQERFISHILIDEPGTWEEKAREEKERPSAREEYFNAVEVIRELADQVMSDRRLTVSKANRVVGVMLNRVGENRSAVLGLATIKSYDEYTSFHSVNVLILALALGSMLPLDRSALMILGTGALLHDLGKVTVPQVILNKTGPLTSSEWDMMHEHPVRGADILMAQPGVHPLAVMVAYEHHARYDLNGYPTLNSKNHQGLFSRIVEIADVYDAMTSVRPYQNARTPDQAIRVLVKDMGTAFDPLLVKVFIDMIGFFPIGTLVRLATGELGIVYEQNEVDAFSPKVKVIRDPDGEEVEPRLIDIMNLKKKVGETGQAVLDSLNPQQMGIDPLPFL